MRLARKYLWPTLTLLAAGGLGGWFYTRSPFQRVLELPSGHVRLVSGNFAVVLWPFPPNETALRLVNLDDQRDYVAERVGPERQLLLRGARGRDVYYWLGRPPALSGGRFGLMGAVRLPTANDPPAPKPAPKPKETAPPLPEFTLRRAHLDGGGTEEVLRNEPSARAGIATPEGYYWVRVPAKPSRTNPDRLGDLMLVTEASTPPRKLAEGVLPKLEPGEGGVYWPRPDPSTPGRFNLVFLSADGKTRRILKDYRSTQAPQEVGERLYWIAETRKPRAPATRGTAPPPSLERREVVSADRDGEKHRVLLKLAESGKILIGLTRLQAYQGRLYGLMWEEGPRGKDGEQGKDRTYLCELHPESEPTLRRLCELPGESVPEGFFDGGAFYFVQQEIRENWRDWSRGGMSPTPVEVLYRFRLPGTP